MHIKDSVQFNELRPKCSIDHSLRQYNLWFRSTNEMSHTKLRLLVYCLMKLRNHQFRLLQEVSSKAFGVSVLRLGHSLMNFIKLRVDLNVFSNFKLNPRPIETKSLTNSP